MGVKVEQPWDRVGVGCCGWGRLRKAVVIVINIVILCRVRAVGKQKKSGRDRGGKDEGKERFGCWEDLWESLMHLAYLLGM